MRACAEKSTPAVVTKIVRGSVGQCSILELVCKGKFWLIRSKSFFSGASGQEEIMVFFRKTRLHELIKRYRHLKELSSSYKVMNLSSEWKDFEDSTIPTPPPYIHL